jgi:hypothetical protein
MMETRQVKTNMARRTISRREKGCSAGKATERHQRKGSHDVGEPMVWKRTDTTINRSIAETRQDARVIMA